MTTPCAVNRRVLSLVDADASAATRAFVVASIAAALVAKNALTSLGASSSG